MRQWPATRLLAWFAVGLAVAAAAGPSGSAQTPQPWSAADVLKLRSVGEVHIAPDGTRIAYTVQANNRTGRPASQIWILGPRRGHHRAARRRSRLRHQRALVTRQQVACIHRPGRR